MKNINIAIDGPAGAGKSSIAKKVSAKLGYIYVDTGALYRSVALFKIRNKMNESELKDSLKNIDIKLAFENGTQHVILNNEDVSGEIRTNEVSMNASSVSAIPEVRAFLFDLQKKIARENNIIMDGRDIGTVVLPDADLKIYLTASSAERAKRRWLEMKDTSNCPSLEEIEKDIIQRDYNDMHRETAPLKRAEDAVLVDSSNMNFEESCDYIEKLIRTKVAGE